MNFGEAFNAALTEQKEVERDGWNGKGMRLKVQFPDENSKMTHPYLYMTIPDCQEGTRRIPWQPSQVDLFATDYRIVE
jgi:hypothetical protein